jgi:hypothetical protein
MSFRYLKPRNAISVMLTNDPSRAPDAEGRDPWHCTDLLIRKGSRGDLGTAGRKNGDAEVCDVRTA